jgi:predicted DNA-binding transcriptional regulator YafY
MHRHDIVRALEERQVALMTYVSEEARTVQPHAIVRKPDGTEILEAYQVRGYADADSEHGWRSFELARIDTFELLPERFEPRRDFRPVSSTFGEVVATVRSGETLQI